MTRSPDQEEAPPLGDSPDRSPPGSLGIIIPTLNEASRLPNLLADLSNLERSHRIVVVDGGSTDRTRAMARSLGAEVLTSPPGRSIQMNLGAEALRTKWIAFLHADSRLPPPSLSALESWLARADSTEVGYFRFRLEGSSRFHRLVEFGQRLREGLFGLVYGDQGLVISRETFADLGGFADIPIMEDVEMVGRIRKRVSLVPIRAEILTSPRRYEAEGNLKALARNVSLMALFRLGVSAKRLAPLYPNHAPASRNTLLIFAKAPLPGRVKTRLAADVGPEEAARIYRGLGRRVTDQLRDGSYRTVVCFDPPRAQGEVERWLGPEGIEYRPQAPGDLGERMAQAFRWAFDDSDRVVIVGTDAPDVDRPLVEEAFERMEQDGLVIGPATDGGYYLLGLRQEAAGIFQDIPWSTSGVLDATRQRARALGLKVHLLPTLSDVDTAADLEALSR